MQRDRFTGVVLAAILIVPFANAETRYDGDRVVRVEVTDEAQLDTLFKITDDVWSHGVGIGHVEVRVSETQFATLLASGMDYEILIEDLQARIDSERSTIATGTGPFDQYLPFEGSPSVVEFLNGLAARRPDLVQIVSMGQSLEGREMWVAKITGPGAGPKPGILYHGGQHAREWITVPTILYLAERLVDDYDTDPRVQTLVDRCEWYLMPVMNPDGYIFSREDTRLWRKNRRPNPDGSFGVDLNRNWDFAWGGAGSDDFQSSQTYRGPAAFSEPETQNVRDFIIAHPNIVVYNDIHAFSQLILWPWGYQSGAPDDERFATFGFGMEQIIESVYGTQYEAGPVRDTLYIASGVSIDWVWGQMGVLAFTYELRDTGANGFLLPADQILPNCEETYPALLWLADQATVPFNLQIADALPTLHTPEEPLDITVLANENIAMIDPDSVTLHLRIGNSASFNTFPMNVDGPNQFTGTLPGEDCGESLAFYISATPSGGGSEVLIPLGAPESVFQVPVGVENESVRDTFESDNGWTVDSEDLSTGEWVRVDPIGTVRNGQPWQPEDDNPAGEGTFCYVTGQGTPGGGAGSADVDGGPTRLISPVYDLNGITDPVLRYARWFASSADDTLLVQVSDDGTNWVRVEDVSSQPTWVTVEFPLADYIPGATQMQVRFTANDNPNNSVVEAAVDDVVILSVACDSETLLGDLNCDGVVSVGDINAFVLALTDPAGYETQFPDCDRLAADTNDDDTVSVADINGFVALLTD